MATTLTAVQVSALRHQAENLKNKSDDQFIAFVEENADLFGNEELRDLAEAATEAFDRMEAVRQQEARQQDVAEKERQKELRQKVGKILANKGFLEAADAVSFFDENDSDLSAINGRDLALGAKALKEAIGQSGLYGLFEKVAWRLFYLLKEEQEKQTRTTVRSFVEPLVRVWETLTTADTLSEGILRGAEEVVRRAKPSKEWSPWAINTLERMLKENEFGSFLSNEKNKEFVGGPSDLIDGLIEAISVEITKIRQQIAKEKAAKEATRRSRQLQNSTAGPKGMGGSKSGFGQTKLGPRAAKDPHYRGPGKR